MSTRPRDDISAAPCSPALHDERRRDIFAFLREEGRHHTAQITAPGAAWLASAGTHPRSALALWESRPSAPFVVSCGGGVFDVVNVPAMFGRRMLDRLWSEGPGSGPVAHHRGRMLLFVAPGTAQRLPSLLKWEEWGGSVPPLLCHGTGDAITAPPLSPVPAGGAGPRWVVAPDTRHPWLPGPEVLLWACVRAARTTSAATVRISIFPPADQGAKVYDVSRRR
ncbi:bifunctional DNA primase/polymerase [Streptomyces wuyuanensis]|uniref:Bifunctional DNA primase/polymerase, N-terminal n=1 Tax=Streptomyces wuyuanensis TaxID=1196353 RepID=A0A1G9STH7_9ACTN|nr:bifunctional DNA primase/polymerase [Streptomyces wuyuanensis]SDM38759.1 Bifunctional DNA primase/polymerase, N-terminal [Streptomyces wuyuanensis]